MKASLFYLPSIASRAEIEQGMAGMVSSSLNVLYGPAGTARAVVDQVMAGEFALGLQCFNHQPVISASQGAPVDWIKWSPSLAVLSAASLILKPSGSRHSRKRSRILASSSTIST